jgi:hypothetical protein
MWVNARHTWEAQLMGLPDGSVTDNLKTSVLRKKRGIALPLTKTRKDLGEGGGVWV